MTRPAAAQGQACTLKGPLAISSKPKGQGRKIHLLAGTAVEILGRQQTWLQLRANGQEGYGQLTQVRHLCVAHTKGGSDSLADLPLEALPLPALAALPDAEAKPPTKPVELPKIAAAAKAAQEPAASQPTAPAESPPPTPAPNLPVMAVNVPPPAPSVPPMTYFPPPDASTPTRGEPTAMVDQQVTPARHWGPLRAALWTSAGVALVAGGGVYIYNNTVAFDKANAKILQYNAWVKTNNAQATPAAHSEAASEYKNWNIVKYTSLGVACLGAALAITAGVFTIVGDDPGSNADGDVSMPGDGLHRMTLKASPFGVVGTF